MKPKAHYRVHKSQTLDCIMSHMNPVHALILYCSMIHVLVIILDLSTCLFI